MDVKPIDLNVKDIAVFFSSSFANRAKLTDNELFAIIAHEIGHNMIKKAHSNFILISIITTIITTGVNVLQIREALFIILTVSCCMLISNYFRRSLEYKSDTFASQLGYNKELRSALTKLYNVVAYGSDVDNRIERFINFVPRNLFKLVNFILNIPAFTYPSIQQRTNKLQTESTLLSESFIEDIYEKTIVKMTDILTTINELYSQVL